MLVALAFAALSSVSSSEPIGQEFIPPEHWSYGALDRFEALGLVALPSEGVFTRPQIAEFARAIRERVDASGAVLDARARYDLERLEKEFSAETSRENPKARYDPPAVYAAESPLYVEGDADLGVAPEKPLFDERWWVYGRSNLSLKLHVRDWITYEVRYRITAAPERDEWQDESKPSPREKSWNGITALYERSYLVFRWKPVTLYWGRDYEDWGPGREGNLIVSRTAGSLDRIGGRLTFRRVRFDFFHSYLSMDEPRRTMSAHRLEFDVRDFTIGVSGAVIYTGRGIDPAYALPFSVFYVNQFNEKGDDNVLWSADAKYRAPYGLLFFGDLLVDDFQFERDGTAPDKLAFDVGGRWALRGRVPLTFGVRYRYVDIYTYTHRDSLEYYVTGRGNPLLGDPPLGAVEGPDADALDIRAEWYAWASVTASAFASFQRRGEGNDWRKHEKPLDPSPPFPSGVVERTTWFGAGLLWELKGNSSVGFDVGRAIVENKGHVSGQDDKSTQIRAFLTWDL